MSFLLSKKGGGVASQHASQPHDQGGLHPGGVKACLHVPSPSLCPSPSKFNIMPMVTVHLMGRMGTEPILSIKWSVSIDATINFDGDGDKDGDGTCKQAFRQTPPPPARYMRYGQQAGGTHPTGCDIIIHCLSKP